MGVVATEVSVRAVRTARSVAWLTGGEIVGKVGTLVLIVGAARMLGAADFGTYSFALSLGLVLAVVTSWGFDITVVREGSRVRAALPHLLGEVLAARVAMTVVLWGAVSLLPVSGWVTSVIVLSCLLDTLTDAFRSAAAVLGVQRWAALAVAGQRLATAAAGMLAMWLGRGLTGLALATLLGSLAALGFLSWRIARFGVRPTLAGASLAGLRKLHADSWGAGVHSALSMALFRVDQLILGLLAGQVAVGFYAAGYRLLETVLFVTWATAQAVFPVIASAPDEASLRRGFSRSLAVVGAVLLPYAVVLTMRGPELLGLLYGPSYEAGGAAVVRLLGPAPLVFAASFLLAYVLMAARPTPLVALASLTALIFNVVLNLTLIPVWGAAGAAFATTAAYLAETVVLVVMVRALVSPRGWLPGLRRGLAPAACGAVVLALVLAAGLPLVPSLLTGAALYCATWYVTARRIDPEQLHVLKAFATPRSDHA